MIIDEVVWNVINHKHCSFRIKSDSQNFCRNQYNLTGLCNRKSCPLANSQYATIKQDKAQRSHTPNQLWEKIKLDKNYNKALQQIDQQLQYWSPFQIHKCKQRLTKLRQMIIQMRKLKLQGQQQIVPIKKKAEDRNKIRQAKALIAANIEQKIQEELLERLKTGVYKDVYNYNSKVFDRLLRRQQQKEDSQQQIDQQQDSPEVYIAAEQQQQDEEEQIMYNIQNHY